MKTFKSIYALMAAAAFTVVSCDINEVPSFSDSEAFVAFTSATASVDENAEAGYIELPVLLSSISGLSGSVDFKISIPEKGGATEGVNYTLVGDTTLTFTKDAPTQYIRLNIVNNNEFGGDVHLIINLLNPKGVKLGASKSCDVTIVDDEHPLAFILGDFSAQGADYYSGFAAEDWEATIVKDPDDVSKVWIHNFTPSGAPNAVYGVVNQEKTEIRIPVNQALGSNSSYDIVLEGYRGDNGEEDITDYILGTISENGTITVTDWIAASAYNKGTTTLAGYYSLDKGAVFTKK